ncbi:MAG TPA: hypothetical protein PKY96_08975 [Flavobacteriales bacterium]|nr:hypothetical protein [Flavobacteriales bacterium]
MMNRALTLTLALAAFTFAQAQEPTKPATETPAQSVSPVLPAKATPQLMAKELGLTEQQIEDLNRIDREHGERMKELNRQNLEQQAKRAKTIEMRDKKQAEIQKAMTAEQWAKWQQMKQAQRDASMKAREEHKAKPVHQE